MLKWFWSYRWLLFWGAVTIACAYLTALHFGLLYGPDYICHQSEYSDCEYRTAGDPALVFLRKSMDFLNYIGPAIAALAAVAVAAFTFTLWRSTEKLWEAAENQRRDGRKAIAASIASARAALKQVRLSERNSEMELRAYVEIDHVSYDKNPTDDDAPWVIQIVVKNFGRTPANDVTVATESFLGIKQDENEIFNLSDSAYVSPKIRIPPQHLQTVRRPAEIDPGLTGFQKASESGDLSYIWGSVSYSDVFGNNHSFTFQFLCRFRNVGSFVLCNVGNSKEISWRGSQQQA